MEPRTLFRGMGSTTFYLDTTSLSLTVDKGRRYSIYD